MEQAITLYTSAIGMLTADSPALLVESVHQKLATSMFAKAVSLEDTELASTLSKRPFATPAFERGVLLYRIELALKRRDESAYFLSHSLLKISMTDSERVEAKRLLGHATTMEAQRNLDCHRYARASERYHVAMRIFADIADSKHLALAEANMAFIERHLAHELASTGKFRVEEEHRLSSAARYYLNALDRLKVESPLRTQLTLDLVTLHCSVLMRYTDAPPTDRMRMDQVVDEAERCVREAQGLLDRMRKSGQKEMQMAKLRLWHAKFILVVRLPYEEEKEKLAASALAMFNKAREFFIADDYPVDFVDITLLIVELRMASRECGEALKAAVECLRALRPTALAIRRKVVMESEAQAKGSEMLNERKGKLLTAVRTILHESLDEKLRTKQDWANESAMYRLATESTPEQVVNLLCEIKKRMKL
jgi:hypothetical protein